MAKALQLLVCLFLGASLSGCVGIQFQPQERSFFTAVDDLKIQTELNARLIGESAALFASVDSTVIEGRVHISGTVPAQQDRISVTRLAWAIPAVREVVNDIEVSEKPRLIDAARDRWITTRVRSLILADRDIRDSNYAIDTENGVIYVNGIAQDRPEMERVLRHANAVGEARRVVNYVVLKDDPRRTAQGRDHASERVASATAGNRPGNRTDQ